MSIIGLVLGLVSGISLGIRYKSMASLGSLITIIFYSVIIGTPLGLIAGIGFVYFQETGSFTSWQLLESPAKFTKIVDANTYTVWAQSIDSRLYFWSHNKWVEIESMPDERHDIEAVTKGDICDLGGNYVPKKQPGRITECYLVGMGMYESSWTVYYALLEDGTIWCWSYTSNGFDFIYMPLLFISIGIFAGVIVGVIVFIRKKRSEEATARTS